MGRRRSETNAMAADEPPYPTGALGKRAWMSRACCWSTPSPCALNAICAMRRPDGSAPPVACNSASISPSGRPARSASAPISSSSLATTSSESRTAFCAAFRALSLAMRSWCSSTARQPAAPRPRPSSRSISRSIGSGSRGTLILTVLSWRTESRGEACVPLGVRVTSSSSVQRCTLLLRLPLFRRCRSAGNSSTRGTGSPSGTSRVSLLITSV